MTDRIVRRREVFMKDCLIGIVASVGLLSIGYLTFSANSLIEAPRPLRVFIDADTGCQFLGQHGAIVPRFDGNGKQLGCGEAQR